MKKCKTPDVVLVDVVTYTGGVEQLEELIERHSSVAPVLVLAREDRIEQLISSLRAGAVGFLKQTASITELRKAITAVAEGNTWGDSSLFRNVMKYLPLIPHLRDPKLTRREKEVLKLVSRGESNKEIAAHLGLSEQSIKVYVSNLLKKAGVSNRSGLTAYSVFGRLMDAQ